MDQETRNISVRQRFDELLRGPFRGRVIGNAEVEHLAATVFQNKEYSEAGSRNREEIYRDKPAHMILQKCSPR